MQNQAKVTARRVATLGICAFINVGCAQVADQFAVDDVIKEPMPRRTARTLYMKDTFEPIDVDKFRFTLAEMAIPRARPAADPSPGNNSGDFLVTIADETQPKSLKVTLRNPTAYQMASINSLYRDKLQMHIIRYSDRICEYHKAAIVANSSTFNLFTGLAAIGLSTAGALVTGGTSQLLSAVSASVSGAQATVNAEIYQKYIGPAITKRIDLDRDFVKTEIDAKRGRPITLYSADEAILDAQRYHMKCSFYSALSSLVDEGAKSSEEKTSIPALIKVEEKRLEKINGDIGALDAEIKKADAAKDTALSARLTADKGLKAAQQRFLTQRIANLRRIQ